MVSVTNVAPRISSPTHEAPKSKDAPAAPGASPPQRDMHAAPARKPTADSASHARSSVRADPARAAFADKLHQGLDKGKAADKAAPVAEPSQGATPINLDDQVARVTDRVPDAKDRSKSSEEWRRDFHKISPRLGGNKGADGDLLLLDGALDNGGKPKTDAEISGSVDRWSKSDDAKKKLDGFSPDERARYKDGLTNYMKDRRANAGLRIYHPDPDRSVPSSPSDLPNGLESSRRAQARDASQQWRDNAQRGLDDTYNRTPKTAANAKDRDARRTEIDAARDTYVQAMGNPENLTRNERAQYFDHLKKNPGDLLGAYRTIHGSLQEDQHRGVADSLGKDTFIQGLRRVFGAD